jgi:hypothetical protein
MSQIQRGDMGLAGSIETELEKKNPENNSIGIRGIVDRPNFQKLVPSFITPCWWCWRWFGVWQSNDRE